MKKPEIKLFASAEEIALAAAKFWADDLAAARDLIGYCCALSGGRIANSFYSAITSLPDPDKARFKEIHYFWADERCVPPDDPESNYSTAARLLFEPLKVPPAKIHRIRGEDLPAEAAKRAAGELENIARRDPSGLPVLDMAILGLGEDGHTASLFPGEPATLRDNPAVYRAVVGPKPPPNRVTLGYQVLAAARQVLMLANGAGKAAALKKSLEPGGQTPFGHVLELREQNLAAGHISSLGTVLTDISLG
jgi:6-phosphogluconolactonase